jgi:hypothetical protein
LLEPYALTRLREEARALNTRGEAVAPEEIDLIVSRGGRRSIRRCGIEVDLPDALLPRTGSGTDHFSLASEAVILQQDIGGRSGPRGSISTIGEAADEAIAEAVVVYVVALLVTSHRRGWRSRGQGRND